MSCFQLQELTIRRILAFNKIDLTPGSVLDRPLRSNCAISIKCSGRTTYFCNGKQYEAHAGNALFVPAGSEYRFCVEEAGPCWIVEFETIEEIHDPDIYPIAITNPLSLQTLFEKAANMWIFRKPAYVHRCMSELYNILAFLDEQQMITYQNLHCRYVIQPAIAYLEANYHDPLLSSNRLAGIAGISEVYFRKIFTAVYGISPARYIRSIRIEKAKNCLLDTEMGIGEIATAVGFSSLYHFSRVFKQDVGISPTEYSKKMHSRGIL